MPILQMMTKVSPNKSIPVSSANRKKHLDDWESDQHFLGHQVTANNINANREATTHFSENNLAHQIVTPTMVIRSGKDKVVCNSATQNVFD